METTLSKGKYKIYHIPGVKIGCTTNVQKRIIETQGYKPGEYEILFETDDVAVMYAGKIVEKCSTSELISNPVMPYTKALMDSAPSLVNAPHTRLQTIPGLPPNLMNLPNGCSFHSRCSYNDEKCNKHTPNLTLLKDSMHSFACWHPLNQSIEERLVE